MGLSARGRMKIMLPSGAHIVALFYCDFKRKIKFFQG